MKHVLILGGSSDIGVKVASLFLRKNWLVTAHYFKNKSQLAYLNSRKLNLIKLDFSKINNSNINKVINKKFCDKYDSVINLVGFIDNKSFENTNLNSILHSLKINAIIPTLIVRKIKNSMLNKCRWNKIAYDKNRINRSR